jgi:ribosomal subunit interface protein
MNIQVFANTIERKQAIRRFVAIRLKSILRRHRDKILSADVHLRDVNGGKGGIDNECTVVIETKTVGTIVMKASHEKPTKAFALAAGKVIEKLRQRLKHRVTRRRSTHRMRGSFEFA